MCTECTSGHQTTLADAEIDLDVRPTHISHDNLSGGAVHAHRAARRAEAKPAQAQDSSFLCASMIFCATWAGTSS